MNFIITFVFRWLKALDTTGLEHMVNRNIRLFLIPMPFSHFSCAFGLLSYFILVCLHAFLTEFWFRILYAIVSFCVSGVLQVSNPQTERIFWQLSICNSASALMYDVSIGVLWFLSALWHSFLGMGSFIFNILFTLLLSMGPLSSSPRHFKCDVDGAST